jgi:sporulation protein YlmC with PRC-barrel domain
MRSVTRRTRRPTAQHRQRVAAPLTTDQSVGWLPRPSMRAIVIVRSIEPFQPHYLEQVMESNYLSRDTYGMYRNVGPGPGPALMGADTLIGNDVYNAADESLGTIKELMIEMSTGKINYAVLSFGGFLGLGDRLFAVPWQALKLDTENKRFVLNVSKEQLKNAPGFDKDHWPAMADATWATGVHNFYGVKTTGRIQ